MEPTYRLDQADSTTGRVASGPFAGEMTGPCNEFSKTMRIASVVLTKDEASAIRERCGYEESEFHLDSDSTRAGVYCFKYDNASMNRRCAKSVTPDVFGETHMGVWLGKLPLVEESRYQSFKEDYEPYMVSSSNAWQSFWEALPLGFALSAPFWVPAGLQKARSISKKVSEFFKRPPKDPPAGGSSGDGRPKSDILILPGDPGFNDPERSMVAEGSALVLLGYALAQVAKAAVPILQGAATCLSGMAGAFVIMPGPVMEQMMDPNRGKPPDA